VSLRDLVRRPRARVVAVEPTRDLAQPGDHHALSHFGNQTDKDRLERVETWQAGNRFGDDGDASRVATRRQNMSSK
jgi:hypothetical protein